MNIIELIELMKRVEPLPSVRQNSAAAKAPFESLEVGLSAEVEYFYLRYEGPHGSRYTGVELLDPCAQGEYSMIKATEICRDIFNLPVQFLVVSKLLGNSVFVLDTYSNEVYNVDFEGGLEYLLQGRLDSVGEFGTFIREFFSGRAG